MLQTRSLVQFAHKESFSSKNDIFCRLSVLNLCNVIVIFFFFFCYVGMTILAMGNPLERLDAPSLPSLFLCFSSIIDIFLISYTLVDGDFSSPLSLLHFSKIDDLHFLLVIQDYCSMFLIFINFSLPSQFSLNSLKFV